MSTPNSLSHGAVDPLIELVGFRLSTATVLFHGAVADRLGVSVTDLKCYSILQQSGAKTAGELAEGLGLTTGAITGVIDRLERAGLVQRQADPSDRRRVIVALRDNPERAHEIGQLYAPMGQGIMALVGSYSEAERAIIMDFVTKATAVLESATATLRSGAE